MKIFLLALSLVFLIPCLALSWGNKNASGQITSLNQANEFHPSVIVNGYTDDGYLWLGFSFRCGGGQDDWHDRKAKKVKGKFSTQFNMSMCPQGYDAIRSCLWKGKSGGLMKDQVHCKQI